MLFTAAIYARFSIDYTTYRIQFRIAMNKADMEAGNLATDSLLNYETVKFFGNERFEAMRYDDKLARYEQAALKTDRTLATLNIGPGMRNRTNLPHPLSVKIGCLKYESCRLEMR